MNAKRVVLILTFAIFTVSALYAGPCINCVATVYKKDNHNKKSQTQWSTESIIKSEDKKSSSKEYYVDRDNVSKEYIDSMIALDDNDYISEGTTIAENEAEATYPKDDDITLTYDNSAIKLAKTLYACEDIANNIVACDNEKKEECECV
jgi:hypothetical protein